MKRPADLCRVLYAAAVFSAALVCGCSNSETTETAVQQVSDTLAASQGERGQEDRDEGPFRYGFKPGVTYNYAFRLDARASEEKRDDAFWLYGGVGYTTMPADEPPGEDEPPRLNVDYHASLYMKGSGSFSMGSEGAMSHMEKQEHGSLVINTRGEFISGKYEVSVPFLFVALPLLPLDRLADGETSWVEEDSINLVTKKVDAPRGDSPFPDLPGSILDPFAGPSRPKTRVESVESATERCEYQWEEATDEHRLLHRRYELNTADGGFQASYDSVVTFDRRQQVPLRMDGEGTIQIKSENVTVKRPVKFNCRLTEADAWRASENTRLIPNLFEVIGEAESLKWRNQMQNGSPRERRDLMYFIKTVEPADYRAEIAAEIAKALNSGDAGQEYAAAQTIRRWATDKEAPAILEAVKRGGTKEVYDWVLVAAGRFPSAEAAEAVAAALPKHLNPATAALIEMGPVAEDAAIKLAESSDGRVRHHAAAILGVIGTEKCLPALTQLKSDGYTPAKHAAEKAYNYIEARKGSS